ncbi:hypothetical protein D3C76_1339540 [compost metagenome]
MSITSNHSSSFMRSMRLSRVIPALLTRMAGAPNCSPMAASTASTDSALVTFSSMPVPVMPCSFRVAAMRSAPDADVAVPITVAPWRPSSRAMAWPMPRLAPVTSATLPCRLMQASPNQASAARVAATASGVLRL